MGVGCLWQLHIYGKMKMRRKGRGVQGTADGDAAQATAHNARAAGSAADGRASGSQGAGAGSATQRAFAVYPWLRSAAPKAALKMALFKQQAGDDSASAGAEPKATARRRERRDSQFLRRLEARQQLEDRKRANKLKVGAMEGLSTLGAAGALRNCV